MIAIWSRYVSIDSFLRSDIGPKNPILLRLESSLVLLLCDCAVCLSSSLPRSSGDSFLLLVLCGDAPCCSSILTLSTEPASAARVRAVSPSSVFSSRVSSVDAVAATETQRKSLKRKKKIMGLVPALTLQDCVQDVGLCLRSRCVQRQPARVVALGEGRRAS